MFILLYGQDTYRSHQKLNEIIEHYKKIHKNELNLKYFDFEKDSYEDFQDEVRAVSMFPGKKLLILKNTILNTDFKLKFLKNAKKLLDLKDTILFFEKKEIPESDKLLKFFKKHGKAQEFKLLEGEKLKKWAEKELVKYQTRIEAKALNALLDFAGNDLWQLSNEIKKIINYKKKQDIEVKDVKLLVRPKVEIAIFDTVDAIANRDKKKALSLIHRHLEKGDSPLYLLSMINFQFRNLLIMKSSKFNAYPLPIFSKKLGIHPYAARKALEQSKKFSLEELKKIYQKIFQFDLAIKTGKLSGGTALDLFIAEI